MSRQIRWTLENIKDGIEKHKEQFGRIPTARDFDESPNLPSARQIQRAYGGLPNLRKALGYEELDFTKKKDRSDR